MNALRSNAFLLFACAVLAATTGHAAEEDPVASMEKQLKIDFSTFGLGMAEAIRRIGRRAVPKSETEYVVRSEQVGTGYKITWITKKSEPYAPFPEYMKLTKGGAVLLGYTILGKADQSEVISRFGKPDAQDSGTLSYHLPGYQGDDTAIFTFRSGKLVAVEWHWFIE